MESINPSTTSTTPTLTTPPPNRARSLWRSCLGSAFRTAFACAMVGCSTMYAPAPVRRHLTFPGFSYVTAILIVGDAMLGDALHCVVHAIYGTILGLLPAVVTMTVIRPAGFSPVASAVAVALSSFVVALPETTSLMAKRIALGQTVIVYVAALQREGNIKPVLHPVHVAASTAVGVVASVIALIFPYPSLACYEVREERKLYMDMATDRLKLLVNAFFAYNKSHAVVSICQAQSLMVASTKLIQSIKNKEVSFQWERPPLKFLSPGLRAPSNRLQSIDTALKGMELALAATTSVPSELLTQEFKDNLQSLRDHICLIVLKQDHSNMTKVELLEKTFQSIHTLPQHPQDLPSFFFLFCMKLLLDGSLAAPLMGASNTAREKKVAPNTEQTDQNSCKEKSRTERREQRTLPITSIISTERLTVALQCSVSLGLAVLLGALFSTANGYWSGLIVAITITPRRESTFKLANVRVQGTALGSIYGVLGALISQNLMELRFLVLLPWIIFTSFLRRSRMYGPAGGITAVSSAMIILGRLNYGSPSAFAIARLVETFIGLSCSILVELLLQPTRASTLARTQLSKSLQALKDCMESLAFHAGIPSPLKEKEKKLREQVNELRKYIKEAEEEPNFWYSPFRSTCYNKLQVSLARMADLALFLVHGTELLEKESHQLGTANWNELQQAINGDLEHFKALVGHPVKCLGDVTQVKSLAKLENEFQKQSTATSSSADIELGKPGDESGCGALSADEEECEKVVAMFLKHAIEVAEKLDDDGDVGTESRRQVGLCMATLGFCIGGLMKETREVEMGIHELLQLENHNTHINLYDISCKVNKQVET